MDNELLEKCIEHDRKVKERIHALIKEAMDIAEENYIPFFGCFGKGEVLPSGSFKDLIPIISISEARISRNMNIPFDKLKENVIRNIQNTYIMLETQDLERAKLIRDRRENEG